MLKPITIDLETEAIQSRPNYPPKPVGVAIMDARGKSKYYAWGHPTGNNCTREEGVAAIQAAYDSQRPLLFFNAKFDTAVIDERLGIPLPAKERIHDSMLLAFLDNPHSPSLGLKQLGESVLGLPPTERDAVRDWLVDNQIIARNSTQAGAFISYAPGDLVGDYAIGDVERTRALFDLLHERVTCHAGMGEAYDRERFLIPILHENEKAGVFVNLPKLQADVALYTVALETAERWLRKRLNRPDLNFDADSQLAEALRANDVVTNFAKTKTGKDSVSKATLTKDQFDDHEVFFALGYRNRLKTCLSTFMLPWLTMAEQSGGRIFTNWRQIGARTGRFSSSPNFQNMPSKWYGRPDGYEHPHFLQVPELPILRSYIMPDPGCILVGADYSSQEVRVAAHFEDAALMEAYQNNPDLDPHAFVRDIIKQVTGLELDRTTCKIGLFTTIYGGGAAKLAEQLGISTTAAAQIKRAIFAALPGLKDLDADLKQRAAEGRSFRTLGGREYRVEPPMLKDGRVINFDYKMLNLLIQGSSADQTKAAMIRYDSCKERRGRLLLTVHDELVVSVPEKFAVDEARVLTDAMSHALPIDVPMNAKASTGHTFAETK